MLRVCYAHRSVTARHTALGVLRILKMLREAGCCDEQFKTFKQFKS
jgi:hypothetical protein